MKVLIFGATGMVGQGVLGACLEAPDVTLVQTVGRTPVPQQHEKLQDRPHVDLFHLDAAKEQLAGFDACFFCLGVSSAGMDAATYTHLTYDLTLSVAQALAPLNPQMTFVYVSGAGTDETETGKSMWARVKGKTENDLLRLPFKAAYMFRPGAIQPLGGIKSKTPTYRLTYALMAPFWPLLRALFPRQMLSTDQMGQAMLNVTRHGAPPPTP